MTDEQIIEALATKVMSWRRRTEDGPDDWYDAKGEGVAEVEHWNPLTNPADSKMVREKLAERAAGWELFKTEIGFTFRLFEHRQECIADGNTEERAVALCALKTVGVGPTPSPQ